jgi:hypothetical protein
MTLSDWLAGEQAGETYAVIDGAQAESAVADFYTYDGENANPLFAGTAFDEQSALGPWLLPAPSTEFMMVNPTLSGFYLISDQSVELIRRHWQSLIEAIREGEAVWFRFSDPRIFLPMLSAMTPDERDSVLGPCSGLWIHGKAFARTPHARFQPALQTPWFHIRPHHLAGLYDENRHAYILRRHFWQRMTGMMELHPDPKGAILPVLKAANLACLQDDVLDGVVAGVLTLQVGLPLDSIRAPLMLTDDEMSQVANWLHKYQVKTGVS